jgi:electron transfer flavoprotein alpha subunit
MPDCKDVVVYAEALEGKLLPITKQLIGGGRRLADELGEQLCAVATTERSEGREGKIIPIPIPVCDTTRTQMVERVVEEPKGIKLEDAEIILSGGRGMGGPDGFKQLEEAAKVLKAGVGASRAAVDNGWIATSQQVGLTGKIVTPKVYIAVAISGASQHMTGCSRSQWIVAINKDLNAPVFKQAHFGVVGDWKVILPAFLEKVK